MIFIKAIGVLFSLSVVWVYYIAVMHLIENKDKLSKTAKYIAYVFVVPVGLVLDALLNLVVCLIFLKVPKDKLTTGTLRRYINTDSGYRSKISAFICINLLNPLDPSGTHCR